MVTKGIIKKIPANNLIAPDYKFDVRIPIFEEAGSKEEYILTSCLCYGDEEISSYKVGDVVYIGFEDNNLNKPIILGKLWCEKNNGEKIPLNIETISSLKITDLAFLPENTNYKGTNLDEYIKTLITSQGTGDAIWGQITGTLSNQTDLQNALNNKQDIINQYIASASASGNTLFITDKDGNILTYTPSAAATAWGDIVGDIEDQTDLQQALGKYLPLSGGTLTGPLAFASAGALPSISTIGSSLSYILGITPFASGGQVYYQKTSEFLSGYATQSWVISNYLPLSGGTLTGSLNAGSNAIYAETIGVPDGNGGFSAGWYWDGEVSTYILTNNAGPVEVLVSTYLRDTYVYGSLYYNGAEVATVNDIPSVYNESLTITLDSSSIGSFTANASSSTIININLSGYLSTNSYINQSKLNDELYYWGSSIYAQTLSEANTYASNAVASGLSSAKSYAEYVAALAYASAVSAIGSSTLTVQLDGTNIGTFNANATSNSTININLSGSGYNKVIANPVLATTDTLNNIYIGGVNYAIPGATGTFVPYVGASKNVNISTYSLIADGFYFYSASFSSGSISGYDAGLYYEGPSNRLWITNFAGYISVYASRQIYLYNASGGMVFNASSGNINLLVDATHKAYYGSAVASNEIAKVGDFSSYVPYSGATQSVTLGNYGASGLYFSAHKANASNSDIAGLEYSGIRLFQGTAPNLLEFPSISRTEVIATETYVQANASNATSTLSTLKVGSTIYNIPGAGAAYVPYTGASSTVDLNSQAIQFSLNNASFGSSAITTLSVAGLSVDTGGYDGGVEVKGGNAHIREYNSSGDVYAEFGHDDGDDVEIHYVNETLSRYNTYRFPYSTGTIALQEYVDNRHTMYNTDSLSDANIDRILIAGGVVILEDSSPLLDLSLAMTPTLINNNQGLNLNMINSINNNDSIGDKGLSLTIENSIN